MSVGKIVTLTLVSILVVVTVSTLGVSIADLVKDHRNRVEVSTSNGITFKKVYREGSIEVIIVEADIAGVGTGPAGALFAEIATRDLTTSAFWIEKGANFADDRTLNYLGDNRDVTAKRWDKLGSPGKSANIPGFLNRALEMQTSNVAGGGGFINNANYVSPWEGWMDHAYEVSGENPNMSPTSLKAARKAVEKFHPISGTPGASRGTSGPISIMEVPIDGATAVADKFATAFEAVTPYDTVTDYTTTAYGFSKTWQLMGTPDGRRSYSFTTDYGILNSSMVTRCGPSGGDYCGINGRRLKVWVNSEATRLIWDLTGAEPRCIGFHFIRNGIPHIARARKAVSLNAGLFSPRLLQISGVGDTAILAPLGIEMVAHVPNVGKRLSNHVAYSYTLSSPSGARATDPDNGNFTCTMGGFLPDPLNPSDPRRGIQYIIQDGNSDTNEPVTTTKVITVFHLHPKSRGYQHPLSASYSGPWNTVYGYFDDTDDIDTLLAVNRDTFVPLAVYMADNPGTFSGYAFTNPNLATMNDTTLMTAFLKSTGRHAHHGSEIDLLAPCEDGGVVDPSTGKVCGVSGLFHIDTAVLPQPDGNNEGYVLPVAHIYATLASENNWFV